MTKTPEQIASAYRTLDAALAHKNAFNMLTWASTDKFSLIQFNFISLADLEKNSCGTTACLAGWHAALAGYKIQEATGLLGMGAEGFSTADEFATKDLGLTDQENIRLFHCLNDEVEEVVLEIFGPRP